MFIKSDFILKIQGMCIDCTLEIRACLLPSYVNLVRISKRQCMSLLNVLPHKLVTPFDTTMAFPAPVNPSFSVGLAGVHLVRLCIVNVGLTIRE